VSQAHDITLSGSDIKAEGQGCNVVHYLVSDIVVGRDCTLKKISSEGK